MQKRSKVCSTQRKRAFCAWWIIFNNERASSPSLGFNTSSVGSETVPTCSTFVHFHTLPFCQNYSGLLTAGLLLHGPPGTGKTSLVKALAHYTNRSIVSVPLTLISTNQQLADVVFDAKYNVVGEELASVMGYSKTIFLLEDVDAVGSIVQKRTSSAAAQRQFQRSTAADTARTPQAPTDLDSWEDADLTSNEANEVSSKVYGPEKKSALSTWADHPDKLNLAGLLNVIDGIIECVVAPRHLFPFASATLFHSRLFGWMPGC
mmetsp:Transcript_6984/g.20432  ORF Transcript_6984/g.20432 Transcript_6984/m.20432 type:complete len:262 (-) Transcript_6984:898-1683(-)